MITQEYLKSVVNYNPETGIFTWKKRPLKHFKNNPAFKTWNTKFAGFVAGGDDGRGYLRICIKGQQIRSHRLAWLYIYGSMPKDQIDHINHQRYDNRIKNLRESNNKENHLNVSMQIRNKSGFTGVSWCKNSSKWVSKIMGGGRNKNLGLFDQLSDAVHARVNAEKLYGYHQNHGIERGDTN